MQLVNATHKSQDDLEVAHVLHEHPLVAYRLTMLLNSYRTLARMLIDDIHEGERDTADAIRSLAKKDNEMERLGISFLETSADWAAIRKALMERE